MPYDSRLRKQWVEAGYDSKMGSACVVTPPSSQFRRVYHLASAEFAISNIAFGRLRVSRFSDSNDPFELMALTFNDGTSRNTIRKFKEEFDRKIGLLCFSANWTSPVLWSHYGARHRGICLGFNVPRGEAIEVRYADDRLRTQVKKINDQQEIDDALQDLLISTKFRHWNYENEFRVKVPLAKSIVEGNNHLWPFGKDLTLTEIILGPLCELSLDAIRKIAEQLYPSAVTFQARLAIKSFDIVPKESTVP